MGSIYDLPFVKYWMTLPELPKEKECTLWGVIIPEKIQNYKLSEVETDIKNEEIRLIYKN